MTKKTRLTTLRTEACLGCFSPCQTDIKRTKNLHRATCRTLHDNTLDNSEESFKISAVHKSNEDYVQSRLWSKPSKWSGDASDGKSTTGCFYKLSDSGGAISWNCRKYRTVASSSCEAEYQGICAAVEEATFLRQLMPDMIIRQVKATPIAESN